MRRQTGRHGPGLEGKGEVIEVSIAPLSVLDRSAELLQTGFWGSFKQSHGWRAHAFTVRGKPAPEGCFDLLVLSRRIARAASLAYVPFGPCLDPGSQRGALLADLAAAVRPQLPADTLLLRFDLPWVRTGGEPSEGAGRPAVRRAPVDVQPPCTVVVDIESEPEAILAAMKPKTRYNIRLAIKKGVKIREALPGEFDAWYALYRETGRRDRIAIHSASYYRALLEASYPGERPVVRLLLATHEGDLLAGNIVAFWRNTATYLYGASSGLKRSLMPTYALQWEAILQAKALGCTRYDLFGIPSRPSPQEPMFGLYQFKTGFSQQLLMRWGSWDAPYRPSPYLLYRWAESARGFYFRKLKKRLAPRAS